MKKVFFVLIAFLVAANLQSQPFTVPAEEQSWLSKDRTFEMGLANVNVGFANNFLTASEIFSDVLVIDLANLSRGFNFAFDANIRPLFFNYSAGRDRWGFGLDLGNTTVYGNLDVSGNLLHFRQTSGDQFGMGAAVFSDIGIPIFFHVDNVMDRRLRISLRPAWFVPIFYTVPSMRYTNREVYRDGRNSTFVEIDFGARIHAPMSLQPLFGDDQGGQGLSSQDITSALGFDFSLGLEFPLISNLDVGVNFTNIPLSRATLAHYMEIRNQLLIDSSNMDLTSVINGDGFPDDFFSFESDEAVFGQDSLRIVRPFKMVFYANYRPLDRQILTIVPSLGFSVNPLFVQTVSLEAGVRAQGDFGNIFMPAISIGYEDQMWRNGFDFVLNLRVIEIGFGVSMQSQQFVRSWQAAGLRANLGIKMGF
ncbi:MAG: hypothetical protein FWC97_04895 [Treponema sp.]|nr:hypothetical protein [Treponema sp.]